MIEVKRFHTWDEAQPWATAWNDLVTASDGLSADGRVGLPSIFQTFQWNRIWWEVFGAGHELLLLGAFENGKLVGAAPFMISQKWFPAPSRVIRFIGGPNFSSDFCTIIQAPGREDAVQALGRWIAQNP